MFDMFKRKDAYERKLDERVKIKRRDFHKLMSVLESYTIMDARVKDLEALVSKLDTVQLMYDRKDLEKAQSADKAYDLARQRLSKRGYCFSHNDRLGREIWVKVPL